VPVLLKVYYKKQNIISSPDSSGILLWRPRHFGTPQEIQRMAGGKVREKMKRMLQKIMLFAFKINYNTLDNNQTDVKKLYNGNIAETRWRTNFDNLTRSYGYTYDALNRLTNAQYPRSRANPFAWWFCC
jgi:hypothetical protein